MVANSCARSTVPASELVLLMTRVLPLTAHPPRMC